MSKSNSQTHFTRQTTPSIVQWPPDRSNGQPQATYQMTESVRLHLDYGTIAELKEHPAYWLWCESFKRHKFTRRDLAYKIFSELFVRKVSVADRWGCVAWLEHADSNVPIVQVVGAAVGLHAFYFKEPVVYIDYVHTFPSPFSHDYYLLHFGVGLGTWMMMHVFRQLKRRHQNLDEKENPTRAPLRASLVNIGGAPAFVCYCKAAYLTGGTVWMSKYASGSECSHRRNDYEEQFAWLNEVQDRNKSSSSSSASTSKSKHFIQPCVPHWVKLLQRNPDIEYRMHFEFL